MAVKYAKFIVLKSDVSGVLPTVPTVSDHYKSGWIQETDIYEGEFFLNTADQAVFTRCGDTIIQIAGTAFAQTLVSLHDVDVSGSPGIQDGDVLVYDSATQTWIPGPGGEIGLSGYSGAAGASGTSGYSGTAGESGTSGYSGATGADGLDGISGASGASGAVGISGYSGAVGTSGYSGYEGTSGARGADGANTLRWNYGDKSWHYGEMIANDVNLASATVITLNEKDAGNVDRTNWSETVKAWVDAGNYAIMMVSRPGSATDVGVYYVDSVTLVHTITDYYSYGVTPITGYGSFELDAEYAVSWVLSGPQGAQGEQGVSGYSGRTGASGASGYSGTSGKSGYSGAVGIQGISGTSGKSGYSGATGKSGYSGVAGTSGTSGKSGYSGYSGLWGGNSVLLYLKSSTLDPSTPDVAGLNSAGDFGYRMHNPVTNFDSEVYELYFRNDDQEGSDLSDWFDEMTASTSDVKGHVRLFKPNSSPLDYALFRVDSLIEAGTGPGTLRRIGVTYLGGTVSAGSSNFVLSFVRSGESGTSGVSGYSGATGPQGISGYSGMSGASTSGYSGISGYSGATGAAGTSGASGTSGTSGKSGYSGATGAAGTSGTSGASGTSGKSGYSGAVGAAGTSGTSGASGMSGYSGAANIGGMGFALSNEETAITGSTSTPKVTFYCPAAVTIASVFASLNVTGASATTFDVHKNGTTIFSTKPTIDANEYSTATAATPSAFSSGANSFAAGDKIELFVDSCPAAAAGAKIFLM